MPMPSQKPGKSEQSVGTPWEFITAVESLYGPLAIDLAADEFNYKAKTYLSKEKDALSYDWSRFEGNLWLNPPYADIEPWVKKASEDADIYTEWCKRILVLIPASVSSNYFKNYIHNKALVLFLSPRINFIGHKHPYPKDLILCIYGEIPGYKCWRWDCQKE